jgi:hypothetical protein
MYIQYINYCVQQRTPSSNSYSVLLRTAGISFVDGLWLELGLLLMVGECIYQIKRLNLNRWDRSVAVRCTIENLNCTEEITYNGAVNLMIVY